MLTAQTSPGTGRLQSERPAASIGAQRPVRPSTKLLPEGWIARLRDISSGSRANGLPSSVGKARLPMLDRSGRSAVGRPSRRRAAGPRSSVRVAMSKRAGLSPRQLVSQSRRARRRRRRSGIGWPRKSAIFAVVAPRRRSVGPQPSRGSAASATSRSPFGSATRFSDGVRGLGEQSSRAGAAFAPGEHWTAGRWYAAARQQRLAVARPGDRCRRSLTSFDAGHVGSAAARRGYCPSSRSTARVSI